MARTKKAAASAIEQGVLMMRTCRPGGLSHGGFVWPLRVGATVEAPDWNPSPVCGGGLHGLPWGEGDGNLLDWSPDAVWLVVEAVDMVRIDGSKAKARRCTVRFVGDRHGAAAFIQADLRAAGRVVVGGTATAGDRGTATAGYGGTATAGYGGTATAGPRGTATAGYYGTATAGEGGTATAGYRGTATAGYYGTATAGVGGTATAGDGGTATAGDGGTATAGYGGTATAGYGGTATAGEDGVLVIRRWNGKRCRFHVANVGEDGIEPDVAYRLDSQGRFVKAGA